jgi:hypothetical protein
MPRNGSRPSAERRSAPKSMGEDLTKMIEAGKRFLPLFLLRADARRQFHHIHEMVFW